MNPTTPPNAFRLPAPELAAAAVAAVVSPDELEEGDESWAADAAADEEYKALAAEALPEAELSSENPEEPEEPSSAAGEVLSVDVAPDEDEDEVEDELESVPAALLLEELSAEEAVEEDEAAEAAEAAEAVDEAMELLAADPPPAHAALASARLALPSAPLFSCSF